MDKEKVITKLKEARLNHQLWLDIIAKRLEENRAELEEVVGCQANHEEWIAAYTLAIDIIEKS